MSAERNGGTWGTVSLEPTLYFAREQFNGVVFFMTDRHSLLSVLVTHEALRELAGKPFPDAEYLEQFESFRSEFELAASDKFLSGDLEIDGSIRIEAAKCSRLIPSGAIQVYPD